MPKTKLPTCNGCKREAAEVYDLSNDMTYFCHYCRKRVISEEEIQAWIESGPIDENALAIALEIIQRRRDG
jgi:DNA-directed RNA polymerase subunit RPC12/RpoP